MKKIAGTIMVVSALFIALSLHAQGIDGVVNGLKKGNAAQVTENAGDSFSLTLLDKSGNYKNAQAQQLLKDFFGKNTVKAFDLKHKGNSPNGQYAIGTLATTGGSYRVNIFMKKDNRKEVIKELRIQLIE